MKSYLLIPGLLFNFCFLCLQTFSAEKYTNPFQIQPFNTQNIIADGGSHFVKVWTGSGTDHMNINVVSAKMDNLDLEAGDEIGIFDGNLCVGADVLTGTISQTMIFRMVVSSSDGSGNGYTAGHSISYKFFDKSKNLEIEATPDYVPATTGSSTDGKFAVNATAFVKLSATVSVNHPPVASAGSDQTVNEGTTVTLDGTASSDADGNPLTYRWTAPAGITLSSATAQKPSFTTPEVSANTSFTFTLVTNDGSVDSPSDQVIITVKNIQAANHFTKVWSGNGTDQMNIRIVLAKLDNLDLESGDEIGVFDGNLCVGAEVLSETITSGKILSIEVSSNDGSGNGYTAGHTIAFRTFDKSKDLEITKVTPVYMNSMPAWSTDGKFASGATAFVQLSAFTNKAPVANAGPDQSVNEGALITLDGSASSDADGNPLTYKWTAPAGIILSSATASKPTFTAPEVKKDSAVFFTLVVNDGQINSLTDTVRIEVINAIKVGIDAVEDIRIKLYPNPTSGILNVDINSDGAIGSEFSVFNIQGRKILNGNLRSESFRLDLSNKADGIYLIKLITSSQQNICKKIQKITSH